MDDNDDKNETRGSSSWSGEIGCVLLLLVLCGTFLLSKAIDKGVFG
jgi:hypothetical protein